MYFSTANPGMKYSGVMGESKMRILNRIDEKYLPKTVICYPPDNLGSILKKMLYKNIEFPVIVKPDKGERGQGVEKVENEFELDRYRMQLGESFLVQEFITYPLELGVLYYRYPDEPTGHISSLTKKEFLKITGDGQSSFGCLVNKKIRAASRMGYLEDKFKIRWNSIVPQGEEVLLEPIGNHSRGTIFLDASECVNERLMKVFDRIVKGIDGYYYGRFDIKVQSLEDLYEGKTIKILELNGVSSEPAHVYDPHYKLVEAWRDVAWHMHAIYSISKINYKRGVPRDSLGAFLSDLRIHFKRKKEREKALSIE